MPEPVYDYTYDEVREMLHWELQQQSDGSALANAHIQRARDAMTDEVLTMWERAGLTSRNDLQQRVENYRRR